MTWRGQLVAWLGLVFGLGFVVDSRCAMMLVVASGLGLAGGAQRGEDRA